MFRTSVFPMRSLHMKPAFWGVDRDLKEMMDSIENVWGGVETSTLTLNGIRETENGYLMSIDLPGVNKKNLNIEIEADRILISATRKNPLAENDEDGSKVTRTAILPKDCDRKKIQAHCEDGVLYLALPKEEKAKPQKIEVTEGFTNSSWKNLLGENKEA